MKPKSYIVCELLDIERKSNKDAVDATLRLRYVPGLEDAPHREPYQRVGDLRYGRTILVDVRDMTDVRLVKDTIDKREFLEFSVGPDLYYRIPAERLLVDVTAYPAVTYLGHDQNIWYLLQWTGLEVPRRLENESLVDLMRWHRVLYWIRHQPPAVRLTYKSGDGVKFALCALHHLVARRMGVAPVPATLQEIVDIVTAINAGSGALVAGHLTQDSFKVREIVHVGMNIPLDRPQNA